MEIIIEDRNLESRTYRKIFDLICWRSIDPVKKFAKDLRKIKEMGSIIKSAIFNDTQFSTKWLIENNKDVVNFLRRDKKDFKDFPIYDDFYELILYIEKNHEKFETFRKNIKILEDLKVCKVCLCRAGFSSLALSTNVFYDNNGDIICIRKNYSDGKIKYSLNENEVNYRGYETCFPDKRTTFVLTTENSNDGRQYRYIYIIGFDFNSDLLPTEEELRSYEEPQDLQEFNRALVR